MTAAEQIVAAVAWCATHGAIVRFRADGVRVKVGNRSADASSLVAAVADLWPEMPL